MLLPLLMQLGMLGHDTHDAGAVVFRKLEPGESGVQATEDRKRIIQEALRGPEILAPTPIIPDFAMAKALEAFDDDEEAITVLLLQ